MTWKLFLDDEREPTYDLHDAVIARHCGEAIRLVEDFGIPELISFDHDLGKDADGIRPSAMSFLHWLIERHLDGMHDLSKIKKIIVHSRNPAGSQNIASLWDSFAESIDSPVRAILAPRQGLNK